MNRIFSRRQANWDLLRSLSMFMVVVVHTSYDIPVASQWFNLGIAIQKLAIICDPLFFMLSGYFALRPLHYSLKEYYLKKASTILLPILIYSIVLYAFNSWGTVTISGYISYSISLLSGDWWFIPTLIPFLALAPFLYQALEGISDEYLLHLLKLFAIVYVWGAATHVLAFVGCSLNTPDISSFVTLASYYFPRYLLEGYFPVFILGYIYRRASTILTVNAKKRLARCSVPALALTFIFSGLGVGADDPDQLWVIAAFCLFFLFEKIDIQNNTLRTLFEWTGRRSYTIYLFQFTTISILRSALCNLMHIDTISQLPLCACLPTWLLLTILAYSLALIIASVLDMLVLHTAQHLFNIHVMNKFIDRTG